jgi:hypothetical protein
MDKETAKQAFIEGYKEGKSVEEYSNTTIKTAESKFERWWQLNMVEA